jgi:hypothetical protein
MSDYESRLPVYKVKMSKDFDAFLIVMCGYSDCPGREADRPFLVSKKEWLRPRYHTNKNTGKVTAITGRSCPYCFRTCRIPSRRDIG